MPMPNLVKEMVLHARITEAVRALLDVKMGWDERRLAAQRLKEAFFPPGKCPICDTSDWQENSVGCCEAFIEPPLCPLCEHVDTGGVE